MPSESGILNCLKSQPGLKGREIGRQRSIAIGFDIKAGRPTRMKACDTFNVKASFPTLDEARRQVIDEIKLDAVPELRGDPDLNATNEGVAVLCRAVSPEWQASTVVESWQSDENRACGTFSKSVVFSTS